MQRIEIAPVNLSRATPTSSGWTQELAEIELLREHVRLQVEWTTLDVPPQYVVVTESDRREYPALWLMLADATSWLDADPEGATLEERARTARTVAELLTLAVAERRAAG